MPPVMGGEDFGRFARDDKSIKSLIFWVGGVPAAEIEAAKTEGRTLPSLHSPFWAPDAPAVISTATEALTSMAMKLLAQLGRAACRDRGGQSVESSGGPV